MTSNRDDAIQNGSKEENGGCGLSSVKGQGRGENMLARQQLEKAIGRPVDT
jgi:hypothetical protein